MIGVSYPDAYAVEETFQLLKVPWEWYNPSRKYDVVLADGNTWTRNDTPLIDLAQEDIFRRVSTALNNGLARNHEPTVDMEIDRLRRSLGEHTLVVEIPPVPWGHPYTMALTHDVDVMSVRERRWISVLGAIYGCVRGGFLTDAGRILGAKLRILRDPWNFIGAWIDLEEKLGVRSTFFFLPSRDDPGVKAPAIRAGHYEPDPRCISLLTEGGWEAGVHGIDNWVDTEKGMRERKALRELGAGGAGTRVHWLLFGPGSWAALDWAGYSYDTTFGYNEDIGFRAGTLQVFRPRGVQHLLELPLHIQDLALLGESCWLPDGSGNWSRTPCLALAGDGALAACDRILAAARRFGGVVTLLWHHESLGAPRRWGGLYTGLVRRGQDDGAWLARAGDAVAWFRMRREVRLEWDRKGKTITLRLNGLPLGENLPSLRARLHLGGGKVLSASDEWTPGEGYVDVRCRKGEIRVELA